MDAALCLLSPSCTLDTLRLAMIEVTWQPFQYDVGILHYADHAHKLAPCAC